MNFKKIYLFTSLVTLMIVVTACPDKSTNPKQDDIPTVKIGNQVWMLKNLDVAHYRNGDPIRHAQSTEEWQDAGNKGEGAWCYFNNNPANGEIYGKLYNWYAVNDPRGLAPKGWHVPGDAEWATLINFLGGENIAGGKLKEAGTTHWKSPNTGATNESGFSGLPGGWRFNDGKFYNIGFSGLWLSSTESSAADVWCRDLSHNYSFVLRSPLSKVNGFSVRCLKD